jgi:hypothetical protein
MTLAQLKRDAKAGTISAELQQAGMWKNGLPERLQGKRKLIGSNTVSIFFLNADGKKSECRLPTAALVEYSAEALTIYYPALRELNEREKAIMAEWQTVTDTAKYQEAMRYDIMTDCSNTYWQKKSFFEKRGAAYRLGTDWGNGCKFDYRTGKVFDKSIRGEIELQYKLYKKEN